MANDQRINYINVLEKAVNTVIFLVISGVIFVAVAGYAKLEEIKQMEVKISSLETLTQYLTSNTELRISSLETLTQNLTIDPKGRFSIEVDSIQLIDKKAENDRKIRELQKESDAL